MLGFLRRFTRHPSEDFKDANRDPALVALDEIARNEKKRIKEGMSPQMSQQIVRMDMQNWGYHFRA